MNANIKDMLERKIESISHKVHQMIDVDYVKNK